MANTVFITGRFTADPKITYGGSTNTAIAKFNVAVDKETSNKGTNFINCVAFGKTAELIEKYCGKGMLVAVVGAISTSSYEKEGRRYYTTEVMVNRIEFLSKVEKREESNSPVEGFSHFEDMIPF